ncbi:hypothetical protein DSM112329_00428 [Paraconexibacter sp. AEG42_29]|uniref:Uncharacterized protein n=1 Tax=Paraconexibacter sp. AEG42_29 TaxID=2997339 RepID=A0AAU7APK4_9ACTN
MRRFLPSAALAVALATCLPASIASAHQGNPNFRSLITGVTPVQQGVSLQILNLDDRIELTNRSDEPVIAYGYNKEPYVRILADGTVQVNRLSPATYLNSDRFGEASTPKFADAKATPQWKTVDKTGRYEWHDHRIHWMTKGTPPQVKDEGVRTKVFDWELPIAVGSAKGAVAGQLFWQPTDDSGPPVGAIVGFAVLLLAGGAAVVVTRRRRAAEAAGGPAAAAGAGAGAAEEPGTTAAPRDEAW